MADLPELVERLRHSMEKDDIASTFNKVRVHVLAFLRATLKRNHALWGAVGAMKPLPVTKGNGTARSVAAIWSAVQAANVADLDTYGDIAWMMACHGMGPKEFHGAWQFLADRVHIDGTKRAGRVRDVLGDAPLEDHVGTELGFARFYDRLYDALHDHCLPYDLRRSYAHWMESAGIPRTRRRIYLGHNRRDVTDHYEKHGTDHLKADAERLRAYLISCGIDEALWNDSGEN